MKIVYASTREQEEEIVNLISKIYHDIFPRYFTVEEITSFKNLKILHTSAQHFEYFGTLREAYNVIASLQTLIAILDSENRTEKYRNIFEQNIRTLEKMELSFPFKYDQFTRESVKLTHKSDYEVYSIYNKYVM